MKFEEMTITDFNLPHVIFILASVLIGALFYFLTIRFKQTEKTKEMLLKTLALSTFVIHISIIWYLFITSDMAFDGTGPHDKFPPNLLFPIATCNIIAFFNLVIAFLDKNSKLFKFLAPACAWIGCIGAVLSLFGGADGSGYYATRSMVSHFLMFLTSSYLFIAGYVKIRVLWNMLSVTVMLLFNGLLGGLTIWIYSALGWNYSDANPMWLFRGLIPSVEATKGYYAFIYVLIFVFIFTALWEQFKIKDLGERWYARLRKTKKSG